MTTHASINRPPTPEASDDEGEKEPTLHDGVNTKLLQTGEKERLRELLRERLLECGWRDELRNEARQYSRSLGPENVTVDELVRTITPRGRAMVPDDVKAELLQRIKILLTS